MADVVADLVAAVLGRPDLVGERRGLVVRPEHRFEEASAAEDVRGIVDEQVEEAHVARDEAETHWDPPWLARTQGHAGRPRALAWTRIRVGARLPD